MFSSERKPRHSLQRAPEQPSRAHAATHADARGFDTDRSLEAGTHADVEPRVHHDFSKLRVHVTPDTRGIIARQPVPEGASPPGTANAQQELSQLNGMSMEGLLSTLDSYDRDHLSALRAQMADAKGIDKPRLQLALDAVWYRRFERILLPEFKAMLPSQMEAALPFLVDQHKALTNYVNQAGAAPAAASGAPAAAGSAAAPAETSFAKHSWTLSEDKYRIVSEDKKNKVAEVKESPDTYVHAILRLAGLDPDAWLSSFTNTTFLGRGVGDIHTELATHLKTVETKLAAQYGGPSKDPVEAGKTLGLEENIGGGRHAPTSAALSMHLFGLAIDVNYTSNPFISSSANPVFERAGQLVNGTKAAYKDGMSYDDLLALDAVLEKYLAYLDDKPGLEARLAAVTEAPWKGKSADDAQKLIQDDLNLLAGKWERKGSKDVLKKSGFLNLKKEFVSGIELNWGGSYGDMMHFDMRNKGNGAKIQAAIGQYKAKKTQEGKETWAKEHGDEP